MWAVQETSKGHAANGDETQTSNMKRHQRHFFHNYSYAFIVFLFFKIVVYARKKKRCSIFDVMCLWNTCLSTNEKVRGGKADLCVLIKDPFLLIKDSDQGDVGPSLWLGVRENLPSALKETKWSPEMTFDWLFGIFHRLRSKGLWCCKTWRLLLGQKISTNQIEVSRIPFNICTAASNLDWWEVGDAAFDGFRYSACLCWFINIRYRD